MTIVEKKETTGGKRRLIAQFFGHVQGVGFRFTVVEIARDFEITGHVQNMMDGSVRIVAEGEEDVLLEFLAAVRSSHIFRYVKSEQIAWGAATGAEAAFSIRYA